MNFSPPFGDTRTNLADELIIFTESACKVFATLLKTPEVESTLFPTLRSENNNVALPFVIFVELSTNILIVLLSEVASVKLAGAVSVASVTVVIVTE